MRGALAIVIAGFAGAQGQRVAPISLQFSEELSAEVRSELLFEMRTALAHRGFDLLGHQVVAENLSKSTVSPLCTVGPCLHEVGRVLGVNYVLVGSLTGEATTYDAQMTVLETETGTAVAQAWDRCDVCTIGDVETMMRRVTQHLADDMAPDRQAALRQPVVANLPGSGGAGHKHLRLWKWLAFGSGLALALAGGIVVARNSGCKDSGCGDEENARAVGITLLSIGTLGIGAGGVLFLLDD